MPSRGPLQPHPFCDCDLPQAHLKDILLHSIHLDLYLLDSQLIIKAKNNAHLGQISYRLAIQWPNSISPTYSLVREGKILPNWNPGISNHWNQLPYMPITYKQDSKTYIAGILCVSFPGTLSKLFLHQQTLDTWLRLSYSYPVKGKERVKLTQLFLGDGIGEWK